MASIIGTNGNDNDIDNPSLGGGIEDDTIDGLDGDDIIFGYQGNDFLYGGNGYDQLFGGDGDDTLVITALGDNDLLDGEDGIDTFRLEPVISGVQDLTLLTFVDLEIFDANFNSVQVNAGQIDQFTDFLDIGYIKLMTAGVTDIQNASHNDPGILQVVGSSGVDVFNATGSTGAWQLEGHDGEDVLYGGNDDDVIEGGNDDDRLYGRDGNDTIDGHYGDDRMFGGGGDDT